MYKFCINFTLLLLVISGLKAQSVDDAYKLLLYGKQGDAIREITKITDSDPSSLDNQLQKFGIMSIIGNRMESRKILDGIIAADAKSVQGKISAIINQINDGGDAAVLSGEIDKVLRKGKKSKAVLARAVGLNFLYGPKKNVQKSVDYLKAAIEEYGEKTAMARILLGEAYLEKQDAGNAVTNFEYAMELDKTNALAPYEAGKAYISSRNYEIGIPFYRKAIEMDPTYAMPWKAMGKYFYDINLFSEAKNHYGKYITMTQPTNDEWVQYGNILFLNKDYSEAIDVINKVKDQESKRNYLNRLLGYSYYETGKLDRAKQSMNLFFSNQDTTKVLGSDYEYLGKIYKAEGNDSMYRVNTLKAFELDSTKSTLVKELADTLLKQKQYNEAAKFYRAISNRTDLAVDWYYVTLSDYMGKNYAAGDSAALNIIRKIPEDPFGYLWSGRNRAMMDTTGEGLSVGMYDKVIEVGKKDQVKYKNEILEAINNNTVIYINKGDKVNAIKYNDMGLDLDGNNPKVLELADYINKMK